MEEVRNMVEDANVAKGKRGGCGFLEDMDDSLLFFFLLLVVLFMGENVCGGCRR